MFKSSKNEAKRKYLTEMEEGESDKRDRVMEVQSSDDSCNDRYGQL